MNKLNNKLNFLLNYLKENNLRKEERDISRIIKISDLDYPIEEMDIESRDELFDYLKKSPGELIYLDNPAGSTKSFGDNKKILPFDYGEFPSLINPADEMGWDVIIIPSFNKESHDHVKVGHSLVPIGYVPVNPSKKEWRNKASKPPPIGNDKIILAPNGKYSKDDLSIIENFFLDLWQFKDIVLL